MKPSATLEAFTLSLLGLSACASAGSGSVPLDASATEASGIDTTPGSPDGSLRDGASPDAVTPLPDGGDGGGPSCEPPSCFYVSPQGSDANPGTFALPVRTLDWVRVLVEGAIPTMSADIHVYLRGGSYPMTAPVVFGPSDGAPKPYTIHYQAYSGESPVLDGRFELTGWTATSTPNVYSASAQGHTFRDLYVGGLRTPRARWPKASQQPGPAILYAWPNGTFYVEDDPMFDAIDGASSSSSALNFTEMVVPASWTWGRMRIATFQINPDVTTQRILTPEDPDRLLQFCSKPVVAAYQGLPLSSIQQGWDSQCGSIQNAGGSEPYLSYYSYTYWLENNLLFVTDPGEWFLDRDQGLVYLCAPTGVSSAGDLDALDVEAPMGSQPGDGETFVQIQGTSKARVKNLSFEQLAFMGTNWLEPNVQGAIQAQGLWSPVMTNGVMTGMQAGPLPAAMEAQFVEGLTVDSCLFQDLAADGIGYPNFDDATNGKSVSITNNAFVSIGGTAMALYGVDGLTVTGNLLREIGEAGIGDGIDAWAPNAATIARNDISSVSAVGIEPDCYGSDTSSCNNFDIFDNKVNRAITVLLDAGAIYTGWMNLDTSAPQPSFVFSGNLVSNIGPPSFYPPPSLDFASAGIYLDEGSIYVTVADNSLASVDGAPFLVNAFSPNPNDNIYDNGVDQVSMGSAQARIDAGVTCEGTVAPVVLTGASECTVQADRPGQADDGPTITPTSSDGGTFDPGLPPASAVLWAHFVDLP